MVDEFLRNLAKLVVVFVVIIGLCNMTWGLAWAIGGESAQKAVTYLLGVCLLFIIGKLFFNRFVITRKKYDKFRS